jgi:hypothetical protein
VGREGSERRGRKAARFFSWLPLFLRASKVRGASIKDNTMESNRMSIAICVYSKVIRIGGEKNERMGVSRIRNVRRHCWNCGKRPPGTCEGN